MRETRQTVRELKELGIDVYFEEQNIHSLSASGELVLTFIACYAQAELVSVSENSKWRKRRDMRLGLTKPYRIYGYRVFEGMLVVCPEEAAIVKQVFFWYLSGLGKVAIANRLYEMGIASPTGMPRWNPAYICTLLHSEKMRGNLLHQSKYTIDPISKKEVLNHGELPKYLVSNTHEGIVDDVTFDMVQDEASRRHRIGGLNEYAGLAFRKKIVCGYCGRHFIHSRAGNMQKIYPVWRCDGRDKRNRVSDICRLTDEDKTRIFELRALGYGYVSIAASLGSPVSTIRTYYIYRPKWIGVVTELTRKYVADFVSRRAFSCGFFRSTPARKG